MKQITGHVNRHSMTFHRWCNVNGVTMWTSPQQSDCRTVHRTLGRVRCRNDHNSDPTSHTPHLRSKRSVVIFHLWAMKVTTCPMNPIRYWLLSKLIPIDCSNPHKKKQVGVSDWISSNFIGCFHCRQSSYWGTAMTMETSRWHSP